MLNGYTPHIKYGCRGVPMCAPENIRFSPYAMATYLTAGAASYSPTEYISNEHLLTNPVGADSISARKRTPFAVQNGYNLTTGAASYSPTVDNLTYTFQLTL